MEWCGVNADSNAFDRTTFEEQVFRAVSLQKDIKAELARLGVPSDQINTVAAAIAAVASPLVLSDIIRYTFEEFSPHEHATRYSDGTFPVLYCPAEQKTAIEEVKYHSKSSLIQDGLSRFYSIISWKFGGLVADLRGHETATEELVSDDA